MVNIGQLPFGKRDGGWKNNQTTANIGIGLSSAGKKSSCN